MLCGVRHLLQVEKTWQSLLRPGRGLDKAWGITAQRHAPASPFSTCTANGGLAKRDLS